jgi:O-antigen ligase
MIIVPLFMLGKAHEVFPILQPLRLVLVTSLLLFMATLVNGGMKRNKLRLFWLSHTFRWFMALLLVMFVSIIFSIWQSKSFYFFIDFFQLFGILLLALNCQVGQRADLRFIIMGIVLTIFVMGVICFVSPLYIGGRVHANYSLDPNDTALFFTMIFALVLPSIKYVSNLHKFFLCLLAIMGCGVIVLTESRGGLIAVIAFLAAWGGGGGVKGIVKLMMIAIFGIFLVFIFAPQERLERFTTIFELENDYNLTAKHGRIDVWKNGIQIFKDNWVTGTGISTFVTAEGQVNGGGKWSSAHNSFLEVAVELGLPGFLVFMGMLFSAYRWAKPRGEDDWLGKGIRLSLISYCAGGMFLSWGYHLVLYFILCVAMIRERVLAQEGLSVQKPDFGTHCPDSVAQLPTGYRRALRVPR